MANVGRGVGEVQGKEAQIFQKSRSHLTILGTRRMTCSNFYTQNPKI